MRQVQIFVMDLKYIVTETKLIKMINSVLKNIEMSKSIINKGYTLFLDNWYSSPNLFLKLHQKNTNIIRITRKNRKNMLKNIQNIQNNILKKGECIWRKSYNKIYMKSTKYENEMVEVK